MVGVDIANMHHVMVRSCCPVVHYSFRVSVFLTQLCMWINIKMEFRMSQNLRDYLWHKSGDWNSLFTHCLPKSMKKAPTIARNCLIFSADQPVLEPGNSRLWVWENDILWFFIAINFIDTQIITNFAVVYDMPINSVSKCLCFPIVFPKSIGR